MGDLSAGGSESLKRIIVKKKKTKSVTEKQKVKLHSMSK